jgi:Skp family chaperone for outer membrane proteins
MRRTLPVALPLGLALGVALAALVRSAGAADPPLGKVAVVDVLDVINHAPSKTRIEATFASRKKEVEDFAKDERARFDKEAGDIELLTKDDPKRRERLVALERSKVTSKFDIEAKIAAAQKEYFDALEGLWREVRAEVRRVAEEQGYAIVLTKTEDELNVRSHDEFLINVGVRPVLYYDAAADLTRVVTERMISRVPGGAPPGPGKPPVPPATPGSSPNNR